MSEIINLNDSSPAAPNGAINIEWQAGASTGTDAATGLPIRPVSANIKVMTTVGWVVPAGSAAAASGVGPVLVAPRAAIFTRARIAIKATDANKTLAVAVCKNGTSVFTLSVAAGATALQTAMLSFTVAADDLLTLNITAGSTTWDFTLQLETAS
jgi:Tfp pilus assembly protein PilZ